jgi:diguanylate cyclase (GGDEF)-like protein
MRESLYDRFRPFKPYDLVLGVVMIVLVAGSMQVPLGQRLLLITLGPVVLFGLDLGQRLIRVPAPSWQAVPIVLLSTAIIVSLIQLPGTGKFSLAFFMINVGFATIAFGEKFGIAAACLSLVLPLFTTDGRLSARLLDTALELAVLLTLVAILVRINQLQQHALFDVLTGLRNHRYFQLRLQDELRRSDRTGVPTALVLIDLDNFKKINDSFGHAAGDQVLRDVARTLERGVRASDIVCRYGGEEITIILPETGVDDGRQVAERLRAAVEGLNGPASPRVTISAGVACYPEHAADCDALIKIADRAMYRAKQAGKNRVSIPDEAPPGQKGATTGEPGK